MPTPSGHIFFAREDSAKNSSLTDSELIGVLQRLFRNGGWLSAW